jgi:hypothetical protein
VVLVDIPAFSRIPPDPSQAHRCAIAPDQEDFSAHAPRSDRTGGDNGGRARTSSSWTPLTVRCAAVVATAIVSVGVGANLAEGGEAAAKHSACVSRTVVSHVPGRMNKVWVIRCVLPRSPINRY